jgi:hypothetical protein
MMLTMVSEGFVLSNGSRPVVIWYRMTPRLHTSAAANKARDQDAARAQSMHKERNGKKAKAKLFQSSYGILVLGIE